MDVLAYLRVSTEEQGRSGFGLEAQRSEIERAATFHDWKVVEWITDEASGKSLARPGIQRALELLEDGGPEVLVAAKLDRLSRSALDFLTLVKRAQEEGWALVMLHPKVDMTEPMGRAMATVMAALAELEREMISQRTRDALAAAKARGVRLGRPPSIPEGVSERIVRERADGRSLQAIADGLNDDGTPTAHGGERWWPSTVSHVLDRQDT